MVHGNKELPMSKPEQSQNRRNFSFVNFFLEALSILQKVLCFLASFDYERYRQLKWGYPKAIVTARGIAVFIPSAVVASTLAMWGPAIFGSISETVLFVVVLPLAVFIIDYALIAHSYSDTAVPASLRFIRIVMLMLSIALNTFVVAGANAGALLEDIEKEVRLSAGFSNRIDDLKARSTFNATELKKLQTDIDESDNAKKKLYHLTKLRDAEISGATLSDGIQRIHGQGTKANGFILEINEANQIAEGGELARKKYEKAFVEANNLKTEWQTLESEVKKELQNRQSPGTMVSALYGKICAGRIDVLMSTMLLLFMLITVDCSALVLSHVPCPEPLIRMAGHQSIVDVAKSDFDHEIQLSELNSKRPSIDIKIFPGGRPSIPSAKIFNMRNEKPNDAPNDDARKSE